MTPDAKPDFEAALALDATHPRRSIISALAAAQDGDKDKAIESVVEDWLADAPADAGYRELVRAQLDILRGEASQSAPSAKPAVARRAVERTRQGDRGDARPISVRR